MRLALYLLAPALLCAQSASITGPVTGYAVTGAAIRPVLGIPGAARLGSALAQQLTAPAVSSIGGFALGCLEDRLIRVDLLSGNQEAISAAPCPDAIFISPSGSSAALVYRSQQNVRILRHTAISAALDIDSSTTFCALSDDGEMLLCGSRGLWLLTTAGVRQQILTSARAAAFLPSSRDAILASGTKLYQLRSGSELVSLTDLNASAVAVSPDGLTAIAADRESRKISAVRLSDRTVTEMDCPVVPEGLAPLNEGGVVQVLGRGAGPAWLLVVNENAPRLMFVPQEEAQ